MKHTRLRLLFLLLYALSTIQCTSSLVEKLAGGYWVSKNDIERNPVEGITNTEPPDFIFFHKSGRYFIFNDGEGRWAQFPLVTKGSWSIKNNHKIVLVEDDTDTVLIKDGKEFFKDYKRVCMLAERIDIFFNNDNPNKNKFVLPSRGALLKLAYYLLYPAKEKDLPAEVTISDQEGNQLWKKQLLFGHQRKTEEILLADIINDNTGAIEQNKLILKVDCQFGWMLQAKFYMFPTPYDISYSNEPK